jgi:importin subunit beta-1
LQQAAGISTTSESIGSFEMLDYIVSLREGIVDAWSGIINALRAGNNSKFLACTP